MKMKYQNCFTDNSTRFYEPGSAEKLVMKRTCRQTNVISAVFIRSNKTNVAEGDFRANSYVTEQKCRLWLSPLWTHCGVTKRIV